MLVADKDTGLPANDLVVFRMLGLGDDEQLIAVDIDLRHLPGIEGVFDLRTGHCSAGDVSTSMIEAYN